MSNKMNDLERLARLLRKWPKSKDESKNVLSVSGFWYLADRGSIKCQDVTITKPQWEEERKRLGLDKLEWNGEGLPPAGTDCEVLNTSMMHSEYEECMIHWIGDYSVVYTSDSCKERVASVSDVKFRPIQTEREKQRDEVVKLISESHTYLKLEQAIYDAGYRKT